MGYCSFCKKSVLFACGTSSKAANCRNNQDDKATEDSGSFFSRTADAFTSVSDSAGSYDGGSCGGDGAAGGGGD